MLRAGAQRNLVMSKRRLITGVGVPLPAALTGSLGRWDAYSGIVPDATNGGFKWNPVDGASVLQTIAGTGPGYSETGMSGRPAMLLSTGKSLVGAPALSVSPANNVFLFIALQMAAPASSSIILGNATNSTPLIRVASDGGISIERQNSAVIATAAAGTFPFGIPVLLTYTQATSGTVKQRLWLNNTLVTLTGDTVTGAYTTGANSAQIGRMTATSSATDLNAAVGFVELGNATPTGTLFDSYRSALIDRYAA